MSDQDVRKLLLAHLERTLFAIEKPRPSFRGKVRDIFLAKGTLYMVNTDRISAFDRILGTIPQKGAMLCEQTDYWFSTTKDICPNHVIERIDPQIMVCKKAEPFKIELVVRGYLAGSLMREDPKTRGVRYGLSLDPSLKNYQRLTQPIITPTTKAPSGEHDEPISPAEIVSKNLASTQAWQAMCEYALALFELGSKKAYEQGLLLIDTKYEFGLIEGKIHVIDEMHTSDSSRFFLADDYAQKYANNQVPVMLDKEFLRQHLISKGLNHSSDIILDDDIRLEVACRYFKLTEQITGHSFQLPPLGANTRVASVLARHIC